MRAGHLTMLGIHVCNQGPYFLDVFLRTSLHMLKNVIGVARITDNIKYNVLKNTSCKYLTEELG